MASISIAGLSDVRRCCRGLCFLARVSSLRGSGNARRAAQAHWRGHTLAYTLAASRWNRCYRLSSPGSCQQCLPRVDLPKVLAAHGADCTRSAAPRSSLDALLLTLLTLFSSRSSLHALHKPVGMPAPALFTSPCTAGTAFLRDIADKVLAAQLRTSAAAARAAAHPTACLSGAALQSHSRGP